MTCLTEFQCSTYADGELPEPQARQVAEHLETCGACRRLVDALRTERQVLIHCFQETQFLEFELEDLQDLDGARPRPENRISLAQFATALLAIAALLRPILEVVGGLELPDNLDWLNPFNSSGQATLFINAAAYILPEIIAGLDSILSNLSFIVFAAIVLTMVMLLVRRAAPSLLSILSSVVVSVIALLTVFSSPSYALDVRHSNQPVTVPPGETVDDTLIVFADSVNIDGTVNGDLIAFARRVTVRGTVKGNVISFTRRVEVDGSIEGSIIGVAQSVQVDGQIARNLYGCGETVTIGTQGRIDGNATAFNAAANIDGRIGRDLTDFGARVDIHGDIAHNVFARSGFLSVLAPAHIGGNLTAHVPKAENLHVDGGSRIDGKTDIELPMPTPSRYATLSFYIWQTIWLVAAFLTGMVAFWLFPSLARVSLDTGHALVVASGLGFLGLVVPPIAAIIISITLIGLPLGVLTLASWALAGYLAKIVLAAFLGRSLLSSQPESGALIERPYSREPQAVGAVYDRPGFFVQSRILLAGLVPIFIAINLPFVGGLINFLLILLGLGALMKAIYEMPRWRPQAA